MPTRDTQEAVELTVRDSPWRVGCLGTLVGLSALPAVVVAVATVTGLGLERNLASFPALMGGLALVLLPILGLVSLIGMGSRIAELGACGWLWSLALLLTLPFYFPGERERAARTGLAMLVSPASDEARGSLLSLGTTLVGLLGDEPEPTPLADALPGAAAEAARADNAARRVRALREAQGDVVISYEGQGESMQVAAFFDGPRYGEEFPMIFDTGATYTTLNRAALERLEIDVPRDAPNAVLRTANGEIEAPLVLVDAVWLGDAVVEWVTVAVCEPCASEDVAGLLGMNVSGQYQVSLDHDHRQIQLGALGGEENRKLDVAQWLRLSSRMLSWNDGRLEVEVTGQNLSPVAIREISAQVDCPGGRFEVLVDRVGGAETVSRKMALPRGTDCSEYTLTLRRATWESDRF